MATKCWYLLLYVCVCVFVILRTRWYLPARTQEKHPFSKVRYKRQRVFSVAFVPFLALHASRPLQSRLNPGQGRGCARGQTSSSSSGRNAAGVSSVRLAMHCRRRRPYMDISFPRRLRCVVLSRGGTRNTPGNVAAEARETFPCLPVPPKPLGAARRRVRGWVCRVGSLQMRCPVFAVFPPRLLLGSPVVQLPASSGARHHGRGVELLLLFRFTEARRPAPWRRYNFNERTASDVEGATISGGAVLQTGLTPTGGKTQLFGSKQPRPASL